MKRSVLVTGGAGFIGSNLVEGLLDSGYAVRVLDDLSSGREENLAACVGRLEAFWRDDVRDPAACRRAVEGAWAVLHLAAVPSVPLSLSDPLFTHSVNLGGTLNLLEAARQSGVRRFVLASSSAVYGDGAALPAREDQAPRPSSPYALHKLASEHYCRIYSELFGLQAVSLRYFNVYGPRQDPSGPYAAAIPIFTAAAREGRVARVFGDGEQTRDFVHVGDVVKANLAALSSEGLLGQAVNVASGQPTTVNRLLDALEAAMGRSVSRRHEPPRAGDIRHSHADVSLARDLLGFVPRVGLEEGLRGTVGDPA